MAADSGGSVPHIDEVLRTADDLKKRTGLKARLSRKKGDADSRLREGLKEHLETTQNGISTLAEG